MYLGSILWNVSTKALLDRSVKEFLSTIYNTELADHRIKDACEWSVEE